MQNLQFTMLCFAKPKEGGFAEPTLLFSLFFILTNNQKPNKGSVGGQ